MAELKHEKAPTEIPAVNEDDPYFDEAFDQLLEEQLSDGLMLPVSQ
jgi:hypothetical protein